MLPNFLIIGAPKAGTTSAHAYLAAHPEIHMSPVKEPQFFATGDGRTNGWRHTPAHTPIATLPEYEALFDSPLPLRGEASPSYTMYPRVPGPASRIHERIPDAKLVYLVRDPVERSISHYRQALDDGRERRSVKAAFSTVTDPMHEYVVASRYATQLAEYLRHFPSEAIHVTELGVDPAAAVSGILRFLGADPDRLPREALERRHNVAADKRRHSKLMFRLRTNRNLQRLVNAVPERSRTVIVENVTKVLSATAEPVEVPEGVREALCEHLAPEVQRLRELTGQSFANWRV